MVFHIQASSCSQPLVLLHVEDKKLSVEPFPFLALETHTADYDEIVLENFYSVKAG